MTAATSTDQKAPEAEIRQRSLMVAAGEIAELLKDLCFAANAAWGESKVQRIGNAAAGLDRTTHRLRVAVLGQPDYPTFEEARDLRAELTKARAEVSELLARYAPLELQDPEEDPCGNPNVDSP